MPSKSETIVLVMIPQPFVTCFPLGSCWAKSGQTLLPEQILRSGDGSPVVKSILSKKNITAFFPFSPRTWFFAMPMSLRMK